jgi:hypothetical protein
MINGNKSQANLSFLFVFLIILFFLNIFTISYYFYDEYRINNYNTQSINMFEHLTKDGTFKGVNITIINRDVEYCGKYYIESKRIDINMHDKCLHNILRVLYHEYAHYIYYEIITAEEVTEYCEIYESSIEFPTVYAFETGCGEDFAESYSYWRTLHSKIDIERINYFKRILNEYSYLII